MTAQSFVLLSGLLTFGVPLLLALFELRGLGHAPRRGGDGPPPPPPVIQPPPRPLPECLLPRPVVRPAPARFRVLEDA